MPVDVVRRNSGGGLVWLDAAEASWIDVFIPIDDPLYCFDISTSTMWLGRAIAGALSDLGVPATMWQPDQHAPTELAPHAASAQRSRDGARAQELCMATATRGEVVADGPTKLVGISQRRTAAGSRMSCVWYRRVNAEPYVELLGPCANELLRRFCGWDDVGGERAGTPGARRNPLVQPPPGPQLDRATVDAAIIDAVTSVADRSSYPAVSC